MKFYTSAIGKNSIPNSKLMILLFMLMGFVQNSFGQASPSTSSGVLKTVVIDAGHGGKDPGCHGASANEKTVCLSIALRLGRLLKKAYPDMKVVYTRDKDVFIELNERANIANRVKADLFICIHANSASPAAFGAETYVLGLHRTESQKAVAERENATIYLEEDNGLKYKDFDLSPDALIARQLQLSVFLDQSISFADKLQKEFKKLGRHDRGVRQAGFLVLYKTTMPSVLIETGFLTNPSEETFLGDTTGQQKMARAMFDAFTKYKNELEGINQTTQNEASVDTLKTVQNETQADVKTVNNQGQESTLVVNQQEDKPVVFRVQLETSTTKIPLPSERFKGLTIFEYVQDNLFKYTSGTFENDFEGASRHKNEMREKGFPHAFVVAFQNGERINLEKAIKLAKK
jgi:N-acetylmuramoyl-L-alanine amidase